MAVSHGADQFISSTVVINEVYGGAGCGTAGCSTYQNDFIELRNISANLVDISGWSIQYASATGTAWQVTAIPANIVLRPGDTYLIAESFGVNGVSPLPTPNLTGTIAMSATSSKVALLSTSVALTGACPFPNAAIVDFIGVGATANCNGAGVANLALNAPAPSTTTSDQRNAAGNDTDNDSVDFAALAPTPRAASMATAAGVTVGGRISDASGRGLGRVVVTLSGGELAQPLRTLTSPFGYYLFDDLTVGSTYVVTVASKQYTFTPNTRLVSLTDAVNDIDFTADTPSNGLVSPIIKQR